MPHYHSLSHPLLRHGPGLGAELEGVAGLTVDLAVGPLAAGHRVQLLVALDAAEAVAVVAAHAGHHALGLKYLGNKKELILKNFFSLSLLSSLTSGNSIRLATYLSRASWAGVFLPLLPRDRLHVHPGLVVGLLPVAELNGVAVLAVDLAVHPVEEGAGVQVAAALVAAQAVLVERARLRVDLLLVEHLGLAANARLRVLGVLDLEARLVAVLVLAAGAPVPDVADPAVDVVVGALDAVEVVQLAAALDAREALLVIQAALRVHLLSLEYLEAAMSTLCEWYSILFECPSCRV